MNNYSFPTHGRLRRLRQTKALRALADMAPPPPSKFIQPVFILDGKGIVKPIPSLPNQTYFSIDTLIPHVGELLERGVQSILLFPVIDSALKTEDGIYACHPDGLVQRTLTVLHGEFPEVNLITDISPSEYTTHGHCGIVDAKGSVLNEATVEVMAKVALSHARAGASVVAPSAMMDGQVAAIRRELDNNNFSDTPILSYSTKFASTLYEPFRQAAASAPRFGNRSGYQASYASFNQAILESLADESEGADMLMVKPIGWYLDVLSHLRQVVLAPLGGFQVSGEYTMIHHLADSSLGDLHSIARESLLAIFRAGADFVVTYWAKDHHLIFP